MDSVYCTIYTSVRVDWAVSERVTQNASIKWPHIALECIMLYHRPSIPTMEMANSTALRRLAHIKKGSSDMISAIFVQLEVLYGCARFANLNNKVTPTHTHTRASFHSIHLIAWYARKYI